MGDPESFDLDHGILLDADSIPNENQSYTCFSCGEDMTGVYCYACGNKNDNYRRSIWSLGAELFASLTALEGRTWRSLKSLILKPGEMSRGYADGARQKWTSPVRMYLAMSLLLFGYVALSETQMIAFGTKVNSSDVLDISEDSTHFAPKIFFLERKSKIRELVSEEDISAFEEDMENIINNDSESSIEDLERELYFTRKNLADMNEKIDNAVNVYARTGMVKGRDALQRRVDDIIAEITSRDITTESVNSGTEPSDIGINSEPTENTEAKDENNNSNISITGISGQAFELDSDGIQRAISIVLRQPDRLNRPINRYLSQIMFFMMPFSMLMGAIFIRGRERAMLYDHLVHAAYIHAYSFLLLFIFIILVQLTPITGLIWVYTAIIITYLPLSAKRMFGRGWYKTFLASYGVGIIYTFIMVMILSVLIIMGLFDIAYEVSRSSPKT